MKHATRASRRPGRASSRIAPTTAAIVATAALALLAAACSGSAAPGSSPRASKPASQALAYAQCVRSRGVPDFPDPNSAGHFNKTTLAQLSASNSEYQTATKACAHLLPASASNAAVVRQEWTGMESFARCMRAHGVPNWPDPTPYPPYPSDPTFILPASIQPVPQTISRTEECLRLVPNNQVLGHIDNDNWQAAQQAMAGQ